MNSKKCQRLLAAPFMLCLVLFGWTGKTFPQDLAPPLKIDATLSEAMARAKKENRLVYLEFMLHTCPHCQAFKKNVLSAPVFREFADKHMVMVIYDLADLASLPDEEQKVANDMKTRFHVESVPTILVFSPEGKQLLRAEGYSGGAADLVVANLTPLLDKAAASSPLAQ
jgi:thioredoxin-related protein